MSDHTPTPWQVSPGGGAVTGPRGGLVARCNSDAVPPATQRRNAAFIVRAANSHSALVAALKAVEWANYNADYRCQVCPICGAFQQNGHLPDCQLDKALRAAEPD